VQPVTLNGVKVQKGMFQTNVDFGVDVASFPGAKIKTEVQQGGSGFVQLGDAKAVAAPEGGPGQCWGVDGNTTLSGTRIVGVNDAVAGDVTLLRSGSSRLFVRASGGIEQDSSSVSALSAAAFNASSAAGSNSFTVGLGRTLAGASSSFVYSSTSSTLPGAVSGVPDEFLVRADGGVGLNYFPQDSGASVTIGPRGTSPNTRLVMRNPTSGEAVISFLTGAGNTFNEFGDIGFRHSNGGFFMNAFTLDSGANRLEVFGGSGGVAVVTNGGAFQNASSRAIKEGFQAVNALDVLRKVMTLPMTTWTYKGSEEGTHMGPIAEDFKEIFNLSGDGKGISTVDANGVAIAAIQGLNIKLEASEQENAALKARLDALEARMK
jgi:trimeric autotransporter adhesin